MKYLVHLNNFLNKPPRIIREKIQKKQSNSSNRTEKKKTPCCLDDKKGLKYITT